MPSLLAIDQGTTSTRAIVFDREGGRRGAAQRELPQSYPNPGWVEHDPWRIWEDTVACVGEALGGDGHDPGSRSGCADALEIASAVTGGQDRSQGDRGRRPVGP